MQHSHVNQIVKQMELLSIDNKLVVLLTNNMIPIDITQHIPKNSIKKIILNDTRLIILTMDTIYRCYYDERNNMFVIENITPYIGIFRAGLFSVKNIKFVANGFNDSKENFVIIFDDNHIMDCEFDEPTKITCAGMKFVNVDVIGVVDDNSPCIVIKNTLEDYYAVIKLINISSNIGICKLNYIPDLVPTVTTTLNNKTLTFHGAFNCETDTTINDVTHVTNKYYVKDNNVYSINDHKLLSNSCNNDKSRLVTLGDDYQVNLSKLTKELISTKSNTTDKLSDVHYCVDVLGQYSNTSFDVTWSPNNHHHFDKYTDKFIRWVILCYKQSNSKRYFPTPILYSIIQLVFL